MIIHTNTKWISISIFRQDCCRTVRYKNNTVVDFDTNANGHNCPPQLNTINLRSDSVMVSSRVSVKVERKVTRFWAPHTFVRVPDKSLSAHFLPNSLPLSNMRRLFGWRQFRTGYVLVRPVLVAMMLSIRSVSPSMRCATLSMARMIWDVCSCMPALVAKVSAARSL